MTEKVKIKLTREQVDTIERYLTAVADEEELLEAFASTKDKQNSIFQALDGLSQMDMARALLIGYDIETEYKTGEWVRYWKNDSITGIAKISVFKSDRKLVNFEGDTKWKRVVDITGHATPEEIETEKERRKWAGIEEGDVLRNLPWAYHIGVYKGDADDYTVLVDVGDAQHIWKKDNVVLYAKKVGAK